MLSLSKDVPLRTRRALSPYILYSDSALLVLNEMSLNCNNTLLALNWWFVVPEHCYCECMAFALATTLVFNLTIILTLTLILILPWTRNLMTIQTLCHQKYITRAIVDRENVRSPQLCVCMQMYQILKLQNLWKIAFYDSTILVLSWNLVVKVSKQTDHSTCTCKWHL